MQKISRYKQSISGDGKSIIRYLFSIRFFFFFRFLFSFFYPPIKLIIFNYVYLFSSLFFLVFGLTLNMTG